MHGIFQLVNNTQNGNKKNCSIWIDFRNFFFFLLLDTLKAKTKARPKNRRQSLNGLKRETKKKNNIDHLTNGCNHERKINSFSNALRFVIIKSLSKCAHNSQQILKQFKLISNIYTNLMHLFVGKISMQNFSVQLKKRRLGFYWRISFFQSIYIQKLIIYFILVLFWIEF